MAFAVLVASLAWHVAGPPRRTMPTVMTATIAEPPPSALTWAEEPDHTWTYDGLTVNYIAAGPQEAPPFLLVHGFGASGFHWRRNVNVLAQAGYRVYAIDLLGFGLSAKPVIDYDAQLWRDQCAAFLREVGGCGEGGCKAVVAGNSIGGYTALSVGAAYPELVHGVVSLNGAGRFSPSPEEAAELQAQEERKAARSELRVAIDTTLERVAVAAARAAAFAGLLVTKQPLRIKQILRQVYPVAPEMADDELVASIVYPAEDKVGLAPPNAIPEVFYRIVSRNGRGGSVAVDELIRQLEIPLLLLWGEEDPWIVSAIGDRTQECAEECGVDVRRVSVRAGHCPQDEAPEPVNAALLEFANELTPGPFDAKESD
jgi:pimeloyl-ACP methyl ester carboxylesterase